MARKDGTIAGDAPVSAPPAESENGEGAARPAVPIELRPLFGEIARLSATLGIARKACYAGDGARALKALRLLEKQLPIAIELAELLAPSE